MDNLGLEPFRLRVSSLFKRLDSWSGDDLSLHTGVELFCPGVPSFPIFTGLPPEWTSRLHHRRVDIELTFRLRGHRNQFLCAPIASSLTRARALDVAINGLQTDSSPHDW